MTTQKKPKGWWGFDNSAIDISVRPQDDFYKYANGSWIKKAKIPAEEARWGSFNILRYETEQKLRTLLDQALKKRHAKGTPTQMVTDFYRSFIDMKRRNALGIKPIHNLRTKIESMSSEKNLLETIAYLHVNGASGVWSYGIDQDSKNSAVHIFTLWQGGLGMPDRDYYLLDKPEQKRVRDAYGVHIEKLLSIAGFAKENIKPSREIIFRIETRLAQASMTKEDYRDPEKVYHKVVPTALWKQYLSLVGVKKAKHIIVGQPKFFAEVEKMLREISLGDWKVYLKWHVINDFAGALSEPFVKQSFDFYSKTLYGIQKMKSLERRGLLAASSSLDEPFGKLYVEKYFPESAKRKIDNLVNDLFDVYEERMKKLDWMSPATKRKAVAKLRAISRKIGYPKKWDLYKGVVIDPSDYIGNIMRIHAHDRNKMFRKLNRPVDRNEWHMSPQTVNAYCSQTLNDIVFPAAILQWPFFDPTIDDAVNYAGIGSVIGHEMTHAFDDTGAKFDIKGNMKNWWTPSDKEHFVKKSKVYVAQADVFEETPGIMQNGELTLGENMADAGGLAIAYDAYQKHLDKVGRKIVGGLSPEMRFFLGFAQMEREVTRSEFARAHALNDPHPLGPWRVNGPFSNFEPFYQTFGLKKGDKLYRDPKSRAQVW